MVRSCLELFCFLSFVSFVLRHLCSGTHRRNPFMIFYLLTSCDQPLTKGASVTVCSHKNFNSEAINSVSYFQASFKQVVLAEKTSLSSQYFYNLQKFVVIERGLVLLPVATPAEAGKILAQMVIEVLVLCW